MTGAERPGHPLSMSPEQMRQTGHAVVDVLVDWMAQPDPLLRHASPQEMAARLHTAAPEGPADLVDVLHRLVHDVFPYASKVGHPGYFAYIPGSTTWPAVLAEFMAAAANVYCGSWYEAAGPSQLELTVLAWFAAWLGLPPGTGGVLVSGGSAANLMALAAARELRRGPMGPDAVLYCSDQAHSSIGRAARVLGFRAGQVHVIPSDDAFRLRPDALRAALEADLAAGRQPLVVCAAAGATNTGAVDPLPALADLCAEFSVWLHVDAAYGGFAALTERGAAALAGIGRADSVTLDPHKWLFQPMECGALLVREPGALEQAFAVLPDYLVDSQTSGDEVNFSDRGLQLTRSARAVKVWASLTTFGTAAFRAAIDADLDLVALAQELVVADADLELMNPASLGIVCFRRVLPGCSETQVARANAWLLGALEATGRALLSSTRLHGRFALRMCVLNHLTREEHVRWTLEFLARTPVPDDVLAPDVDAPALARVPVLALLSPAGRAELARRSYHRAFDTGEGIVSRWATDRDFYVVLAGAVSVHIDGVLVRRLQPGDFFGEIAASDWGSGYGYVRTADVRAEAPTQVLLVPAEVFASLVLSEPALRERVLAARADRLTTL